jgi:excisionase family DNA binding protein
MPSEAPAVTKLMYTRTEASFSLGVSKRSLDKLIKSKKLPSRQFGRKVMVSFDALVKFSKQDHNSLD